MKQILTRFVMAVVGVMMMWPYCSYASPVPEEGDSPEVTDVTDSGCTNRTRASSSRTLVLTKEGDIVTCEINGIVANCGVDYFDIQPEYAQGKNTPDTLFFNVSPVVPSDADCTCPYNVSFTIRNVKADSFFLNCWLFTGMVSFKESDQITLKFSSELVTIGNMQFYLYKPGQQAMLYKMTDAKDDVHIPSTISYDDKDYTVASLYMDGLWIREMTKLVIPRTICRFGDNGEFKNLLNARSPQLDAINVESGCPLLSSVDGVLYSADHKTIYCFPAGKNLTDYRVSDGVERIGIYAFSNCQSLKTIRLPESLTIIRPGAFAYSNNLESIYIPGILSRECIYGAFTEMTCTPTLYVPESEVEYYKKGYKGPVLPIPSSDQSLGISDVNQNTGKQVEHYDLQGRRLKDKPASGVYIQNGKKRVVK